MALKTKCVACGLRRKGRNLAYTQDGIAYCGHPFICNEKHINSRTNVNVRGNEVQLFSAEDLQVKFAVDRAKPTVDRLRKMMTESISLRMNNPEMVQFILDLQQEYEFRGTSEAIKFCITHTMKDLRSEISTQEIVEQDNVKPTEVVQTLELPKSLLDTIDDDEDEMIF